MRIATKFTTPVILLSDGYIANASQPWQVPDFNDYESFPVHFETEAEGFTPAKRDAETLARVWAKPGTPGLEHRIGGIEKDYDSGDISYDSENHQKMTDVRKAKIDGIANFVPAQEVALGQDSGTLVVVGWGSTYGAIHQGVKRCIQDGLSVSHVHVRYMWPLPANLEELLQRFDKVLVPEMNTGQFVEVIRSRFLIDAQRLNKISGQPFKIREIESAIKSLLEA